MSDEPKSLKDLAEEVIAQIATSIDEEVEYQLRALHARGPVPPVSLGIALIAVGRATLRDLDLSPEMDLVIQIAASIIATRVKAIPEYRAAELTDEERAAARRLGAKIPLIGKA